MDTFVRSFLYQEPFCFPVSRVVLRASGSSALPAVFLSRPMAWHQWSGKEVSIFVATYCQLPEYKAGMTQISGQMLRHLVQQKMLPKGLTRAGVQMHEHQKRIAQAVMELDTWTPEEVKQWEEEHCAKAPPIPVAPPAPKPLRLAPRQRLFSRILGPLAPRKQTETEKGLQRSSVVPGHFSDLRPTPTLYEKTYDFQSRGYGDVQLKDLDEDAVIPALMLRKKLVTSVLNYERMRDTDSPPTGVAVKGLRGLQALKEEEESAATRIQASFRQKKAKKEVEQMQQEKREESAAAAKIQARYRGKRAEKEVKEMREQRGAATAIQARYRQRAAQREVAVRRKEHEETTHAATRIQSKFRQKQANTEVEVLRRRRFQEAEKAQRRKEFQQHFMVKIEISKDDSANSANVQISVVAREPDPETAQAATKIQAKFRQRQAANEVDAMRQGKDGETAVAEEVVDIPENEETALAATKIQAKFRQRQAANEVDAIRQGKGEEAVADGEVVDIPENEETALAATKIQAKFRQRQAANEVDAMRQGKDGETAVAEEVVDIPENEETALAATKIQAKFRQRQAANEVESLKKEKEETAQAATKIQAKFRQRQAKNEVDAMRASTGGEADPQAAEGVVAAQAADEEIKADDMKSSEFGEVEAMLFEKQKQQQELVDKAPKVEGFAPTTFEKRPVSVSPVIMEGDEEE